MANVKTCVKIERTKKLTCTVAHEQREKEKAGTERGKFETLQTLCRIFHVFKQTSSILQVLSVNVTFIHIYDRKKMSEGKERKGNLA